MKTKLVIDVSISAPGGCPAGLAWDGTTLWNADYCDGKIYGLDPDTGAVVNALYCPGNLSGVTWDGQALWQSLFDQEMIRCVNPATNDFDETIILTNQGWLSGMAWDGRQLWAVAQQRGRLLAVDKITHKMGAILPAAMAMGDIDYRDGSLWASIAEPMRFDPILERFEWSSDQLNYALVQIDPLDGREIGRFATEMLYSGLCWVGENLWLAHSSSRKLFRGHLVQSAVG